MCPSDYWQRNLANERERVCSVIVKKKMYIYIYSNKKETRHGKSYSEITKELV